MTRVFLAAAAVLFATTADASAQPIRRLLFGAPATSGGCANGQCGLPAPPVTVQAAPVVTTTTSSATVTYTQLLTRIQSGERLTVGFGVPAAVVVTDYPKTVRSGVYDCFVVAGVPKMAPLRTAARAMAGAVAYNRSHACPTCGRSQYVISGYVEAGMHTHTCAGCGTTWKH